MKNVLNFKKFNESIDNAGLTEELKRKWIESNGVPDSDEKRQKLMFFIRSYFEKDKEPSPNYLGSQEKQIPHF